MPLNTLSTSTHKRKDLLKLNQLKLSAIVYWAISSAVKRPKTAIMCGNKESMASAFAEKSGFDLVNVLPKSMLQHYGFWIYEKAIELGYESMILAETSRDIMLTPKVAAGLPNLGKAPLLIKQRCIDEQFKALHKLDWLHIEDTAPHLLLTGSAKLLARDKPIITLNLILDVAVGQAVLAILEGHGYQCFDYGLDLINVSSEEDIPLSWVCIHREDDTLETIKDITSFNKELSPNIYAESKVKIIEAYYNSLLEYKVPAQSVLSDYLFSASKTIDVDTQLHDGFYAQDCDDETKWSWSGPRSESTLLLPIEAPGAYQFSATIFSLPKQLSSSPLFVFIDGVLRFSGKIKIKDEIAFCFEIEPNFDSTSLEVLFSIPSTKIVDGKPLGFAIENIELLFRENELQ